MKSEFENFNVTKIISTKNGRARSDNKSSRSIDRRSGGFKKIGFMPIQSFLIAALCLISISPITSQAESNSPDKDKWGVNESIFFGSDVSSDIFIYEYYNKKNVSVSPCEEAGVYSTDLAPDGLPYCSCLFGEWFCRPVASPFIEICAECLDAECSQGNVCECPSGTCISVRPTSPE